MTVSSTYDYESNCDQIIADALANVGACGPGATPQPKQLTHARRILNDLVKSLDPEGMFLWRTVRRTFTTTASTAEYTLATDVISIDEPMSYVASGATARSFLTLMSRDDYMALADRTQSGTPTQVYLERTLTTSKVYLWPVPDATGDTIEYAAQIKSKDFDTGANTPDFPSSWTLALKYGLSALLAPVYRQPALATFYVKLYETEKERQFELDSEKGHVTLVPFGGSSY